MHTTWAGLKEVPPVTTSTDTATEQRFERATTCVFTTDFERAIAFYRDQLGFDVAYTYGEPAFWGELVRDGALLNVRHVDESPWVAGVRDAEQLLSAYVLVADATSLFLELQANSVEFHARLERKPWGNDEFVVRDPDGNLILFGSDAER